MNKKTIQLTPEQAKELYQQNKSYRTTLLNDFTDEELGIEIWIPDWNEAFMLKERSLFEFSFNREVDVHLDTPSRKHRLSIDAFTKLSVIMATMGDECDVDWNDSNNLKHCIIRNCQKVGAASFWENYQFLAFKTQKVRDAFLKKHEQLIKDYFMLSN